MEVAVIFFVLSTIGFGIFGLVMENKYFAEKKALADLRAELEHSERDEELLEEATRRAHQILSEHIDACELHTHEF